MHLLNNFLTCTYSKKLKEEQLLHITIMYWDVKIIFLIKITSSLSGTVTTKSVTTLLLSNEEILKLTPT